MVATLTPSTPNLIVSNDVIRIERFDHDHNFGETAYLGFAGQMYRVKIVAEWVRPAVYRPCKVRDAWGCQRDGWRQVEGDEHETMDDAIAYWAARLTA